MASIFQTIDDVFSLVRDIVVKDDNTLTDTTLLRIANRRYLEMVRNIVSLNEDIYAEISSADLVADQREYVLSTDDTSSTYGGGLIKLQRVEVSYDGTNWYVATPISLQEFRGPTITDADLNNQATQTTPRYWFKDRSVWLAPVPSSSDDVAASNANLYIYWIKRPDEVGPTLTNVPDIPKDFLGVLGEGILIDVFRMFDRTADSRDAKKNWDEGLSMLRNLEQSPDVGQPFIFKAYPKKYS